MMLRLKPHTRVYGMRSELLLAVTIAHELYRENAETLTLTSVMDGKHMTGSLHYVGAAADLRLPRRNVRVIVRELTKRLGDDYDVVLEKDHIHMEFQPKASYVSRASGA